MENEDIPDFCGYIVHRTLPSTQAITPAARRGSVAKKEPPHDGNAVALMPHRECGPLSWTS
jgi:hypothetical protein